MPGIFSGEEIMTGALQLNLTGTQKKQRLLTMIFGAFAIFFTGYPHVWSIYQSYVMEQAGWSQGQASMCFYLALSTFVFGNIVGGRMQDRLKEKTIVWIGGGIFAAGILASAFMIVSTPVPMYLTYGVMQGFGQGMIYTVILATVQRWFPDRTGFASGVVVTANGLCGFFLAPLSRKLLEAAGVQKTLLAIGIAITVSWILCGIFFQAPEKGLVNTQASAGKKAAETEIKQYTSAEMMRTKNFYLLLATMFFGLTSYFMISPVSQTYQIELGIPSAVAVSAVMFGSIVNAGARLVLPTLADKVGRIVCIKGVLIVAVIAMAVLAVSRSLAVTVAVVLMYGCYGGIMGSFPSLTSSIFGMKHTGENYGFVMFGVVFATFGAPAISGMVSRNGYGMNVVFGIGAVFAVIAFVCLTLLGRNLVQERKQGGAYNKEKCVSSLEN